MSEDEPELGVAPLFEHLTELRVRAIKALSALGLSFVLCAFFSEEIFNLLLHPFESAVGDIGEVSLIYTAPQEFFITQVKLSLFGAVFLAFPFIAGQFYLFIAPGLYKKERALVLPFLVLAPLFFLLGAFLVYFLIMPAAMSFFLGYEQVGEGVAQIKLAARVSEYLSLVMTLILAFGFCFQLPVVLVLLERVGALDADTLRRGRKYAIVLAFIVAAVLTPPDPISQIGLALPVVFLYESSIVLVSFLESGRRVLDEKGESA